MAEPTLDELNAQLDALVAQISAKNIEANRQNGKESLANVLRSAGLPEESIASLVDMRASQAETEAMAAVEANRQALLAEAEAQEAQNVRERAEFAAAIEAGQAPPFHKWAGCPSVDGLPPAPPRLTFGNVDLNTVRLGVQPGEGKR